MDLKSQYGQDTAPELSVSTRVGISDFAAPLGPVTSILRGRIVNLGRQLSGTPASARNRILYLVAATILVSACGPPKIEPPSVEKPTLLVLPAEIVLEAQNRRYGFAYAYEILSSDNSVPPYRAKFILPVKNDMLIVDSLPPGNYEIQYLFTLPVGGGTKTYSEKGRPVNAKFRLEAGKVTILSKSLYVRTYNATPGRGLSTTYETRVKQTTEQQSTALLEKLGALPNFDAWQVLDENESHTASSRTGTALKAYVAPDDLQGVWSGSWRPSSQVTGTCIGGELWFNVDGSVLNGGGTDDRGNQYRFLASLVGNGLIRGKLSIDPDRAAEVTGKLYDDGTILGSLDFGDECQAEWKARK